MAQRLSQALIKRILMLKPVAALPLIASPAGATLRLRNHAQAARKLLFSLKGRFFQASVSSGSPFLNFFLFVDIFNGLISELTLLIPLMIIKFPFALLFIILTTGEAVCHTGSSE